MASSSKPKRIYDVFLSWGGWDAFTFASRLCEDLKRYQINTFLSPNGLVEQREHMSPWTVEAIEGSHIAIIIFSKNFASSPGCLEEVAKIMECKEQRGLRVFPVFDNVHPREVRALSRKYKEAIAEHEFKFGKDSEEEKRWKKALFDAGCLIGWRCDYGDGPEVIQSIVEEIQSHLNPAPLHVAKNLVGIDSRVAKLKLMLKLESHDVVMVGLWGYGGVGKTTLAKVLYNAIFRQFEGACFVANVREASKDSNGLVQLQERLLSEILSLQHRSKVSSVDGGINLIQQRLSHKKVLLVLDDVDDLHQLNALAKKGKWFGNGSRIIVTTRCKDLLTRHGIDQDQVYEVKALYDNEARELLSNYAFRTLKKSEIRKDLMDRVMNCTGGIPLALEVLGSLLCGRGENEWGRTLDELFRIPNKTINDVLRRSYDELMAEEKEIFLHITCFFNGWDSKYVERVLQKCNFDVKGGLQALIRRSLISIDECGIIRVHDLIQLMGKDIVTQECLDDPGRRSRLWLCNDFVDVLSRDVEDCAVKAIVLELPEPTEMHIGPEAFTKMCRLRLLIVRNVHNSFQGPICLPNELRWFDWAGWVPAIPEFSSYPKILVVDGDKCGITVVPTQSKTSVATIERVIGIGDRVKEVIELLYIGDDEVGVHIVGIHGTNGMGKTTIAKAVYDRLSSYFDSCSFLAEIGETARNDGGIQFVQTRLISDILKRDDVDVASFEGGIEFFLDVFRSMKVLIVLDDVEDESHLKDLIGDQLDWFGPGSRIVVTLEDGEIMKEYVFQGVAYTYEVTGMDNDRALELLWKHASATNSSIPNYLESRKRIIDATGQVPFAIEYIDEFLETAKHIIEATGQVPFVSEVIGAFVRGKPIADWWKIEDSIKPQNSGGRLKNCREILKICYEALHDEQKEIFWDIAGFASGEDSRIASYLWPGRHLLSSPPVLMPLVKIGGDNMLWMHKMLKRLRGTNCPRRYMHVTDLEEFNNKEGKEEVEALCFDLKKGRPNEFKETDFKSMPEIRFLKLDRASMTGNFADVFPQLRWLRWQGCLRDFEATEFSLTELVILDLSWSKVTHDWGGWEKIKMEQLKVLNLTGCTDLLISPKFSGFPNLEILILERCSRLVHLDPSIGDLKKLLCLNLKSCTELNRLPIQLVALKALKELLVDDTSVRDIPLGSCSNKVEHLPSLSILSAHNSKITKLPNGVGLKLRHLLVRNCHSIQELPESIGQSGSPLEELDISGTGILELPDSFLNLQRLRVLKMDDCFISKFPSFLWLLRSLEEIHASSCRNLEGGIPGDIGKLENLRILRLRNSDISSLPPEIKLLSKLETLDVLHCDMLHELPALPSSLVIVHLSPELKQKVSHLLGEHCFVTV